MVGQSLTVTERRSTVTDRRLTVTDRRLTVPERRLTVVEQSTTVVERRVTLGVVDLMVRPNRTPTLTYENRYVSHMIYVQRGSI